MWLSFSKARSSGTLALQGPHHVAQKKSTCFFPVLSDDTTGPRYAVMGMRGAFTPTVIVEGSDGNSMGYGFGTMATRFFTPLRRSSRGFGLPISESIVQARTWFL